MPHLSCRPCRLHAVCCSGGCRRLEAGGRAADDPLGEGRFAGQGPARVPAAANGPRRTGEPQRPVGLCRSPTEGRGAAGDVRRQDPRAVPAGVGPLGRDEADSPPSSGSGIAAPSQVPDSWRRQTRSCCTSGPWIGRPVVFVNGKEVGTHRGGYDAFSFDITDALKPGGQQELVVRVFDATGASGEPRGKQTSSDQQPGGIMYTPCYRHLADGVAGAGAGGEHRSLSLDARRGCWHAAVTVEGAGAGRTERRGGRP